MSNSKTILYYFIFFFFGGDDPHPKLAMSHTDDTKDYTSKKQIYNPL